MDLLKKTQSVCPICLSPLPSNIFSEDGKVFLYKECREHGAFKVLVNDDVEYYLRSERYIAPRVTSPSLFSDWKEDIPKYWDPSKQRQSTCLAIVEITDACNLNCSYCFAASGNPRLIHNPGMDVIERMLKAVVEKCKKPHVVQISGGEPTLRNELPDIILLAKELGVDFLQLNTNGIRLAKEDYVKTLKESGLDSVFLSFDGFDRDFLRRIYGVDLLDVKLEAIENCRRADIPITLVPRVMPENIDQVGKIIEFAKKNVSVIKGVHFQPVTYTGRFYSPPDPSNRVTISRLLKEIEAQTVGEIKVENFLPTACANPHCDAKCFGFVSEGRFIPLTRFKESFSFNGDITKVVREGICCSWGDIRELYPDIPLPAEGCGCEGGGGWSDLVRDLIKNTLTISAMHFQDAWDFVEYRVKDCCIHEVLPDGRLVPFCLFNISDINGRSPLRELWGRLCEEAESGGRK